MNNHPSPADCVRRFIRILDEMKLEREDHSTQIKFILEYAVHYDVVFTYFSATRELLTPFLKEHKELIDKVFPLPTVDETIYHIIDQHIQDKYHDSSDEFIQIALEKWNLYIGVEECLQQEELITDELAELILFGCKELIHSDDIQLTYEIVCHLIDIIDTIKETETISNVYKEEATRIRSIIPHF